MFIEIILVSVFSLFILLLRKGKPLISNINVEIKGYKLLIAMAVIEVTAVLLSKRFPDTSLFRILSMSWLIYLPIIAVALLNIKKHYMKFFLPGTLLNFIAIVSNGFKMPVYINESIQNSMATKQYLESGMDLIHSLMTESTRFKYLCDIITLPPPYPFAKTISIGDILLLCGIFLFIQIELNTSKKQSPIFR